MKVNTEFKEIKGIGNIPIDWEVKELNDVAIITMGQSPGSENYNDEEIGLPLIQGNADCINRKTSPRVWTSEITKTCEVGDIIMTVRAPAGSISKSIHRSCIGRGVCAIRYKYNTDYLYHYLVKSELHWDKLAQGTTFTAINSRDVNTFNIAVPKNIKDQEKIAQILSNVDMNIEKTEQAIAKYKQVKKGLMDDLLTGKVRIKDGKRFRETNFKYVKGIGKIPWDWEVGNIRDLAKVLPGYAFSSEDSCECGVRWLKIANVSFNQIIWDTESYLPKNFEEIYSQYILKKGDIVLAMTRPIINRKLKLSIFKEDDGRALLNQRVAKIEVFDEKYRYFIYNFLQFDYSINQMELKILGTDPPNISGNDIEGVIIPVPEKEEMNDIGNVIIRQDRLIEKEEEYLEKLKKLKSGLMEDLLTGKVRVNID